MNSKPFQGQTALITGASSGLGADFAKYLAKLGADIILVARRKPELEALQKEIKQSEQVDCKIKSIDLTQTTAVSELIQEFPHVDILVNNAGFGVFGEAKNLSKDKTLNMLDLNIRVLTDLTLSYLPQMLSRNRGSILQVASIAAYQACPLYAAYGASKSYVLHFSESLHQELKKTEVTVSTLCPGMTQTEFFDVSGHKMDALQKSLLMKSDIVAKWGVDQMLQRKASFIPGIHNRISIFLNRLIPRSLQRVIVEKLMRAS